jgi:DNA repair photolyase
MKLPLPIPGRGAAANPANRFEPLDIELDRDWLDSLPEEDRPSPKTQFLRDSTRTIIATNDSPDIGFTHSINPYRGCEHGCIYCYARPTHEYLGLSAGLDFESKIFVKEEAPQLLANELAARSWKPTCISISGVTDPYQPIERKLRLVRRCLEVLRDFRNPLGIVTKNHNVTRDADVLADLAKLNAAIVFISVTTLDATLTAKLEPRASVPARRLAAIETLSQAGVPVGVLTAPVIPGLTDHELPAILSAAAKAGARYAGFVPLRLPGAVAPLFERWLADHFPDRKDKILNRVRSIRGGKLNDPNFGSRMHGEGEFADHIAHLFALGCKKAGISGESLHLSTEHFRVPPSAAGGQMGLFD